MTIDEIKAAIKDTERTVFTISEVAKLTGTTPRNASRWFDTGRLRGYRIPGKEDRRVPKERLLEFVRDYSQLVAKGQTEDARTQITHHADCWREHHECAVKRVEELEARLCDEKKPFTIDGKDMTHLFVEGRSTELMRKLAEMHAEKDGRDLGSPSVMLENLADDCDLLANHNIQLRKRVEELEALCRRSLNIIADAILHGMPITEDIADLRNRLVQIKSPTE